MINDQEIKISFTGDVMCEFTRLKDFKVDTGFDFVPLFESCKYLFSKSDYVVANLETPVAGASMEYSFKDYNFNTPEQLLDAMVESGITMVTTANNHVLDRGVEGLDRTIDNIVAAGLEYTGTSKNGKRNTPLIKELNGIRIGFISYTYGTEACYNMNYLKHQDFYRVNLLQNQELYNPIIRYIVRSNSIVAKILRLPIRIINPNFFKRGIEEYPQSSKKQKRIILDDIDYCKKQQVDMIIACLHFGGQFNDEPTSYSKETADFFFKSGVDIIVGNHEHLIQKGMFGEDDNKIAYCLGNFTSNYAIDREPYDKEAQCSIVLHLYISKDHKGINCRYAFSVMLSVKEKDKIVTKLLYDEWLICSDDDRKRELCLLNQKCIQRFTGKKNLASIEPKFEYMYEEFV